MSEVIYKKCPKCGTAMIREHIVDNTSVPKFIYACPECGTQEIDTYPPRGFVSSEIPVSGSIRDWNTSFGPSIAKDIPTESGTQKDLRPNFQDRKFLSEELEEAAEKFAHFYDHGTCDGIAQDCFISGAKWQKEQDTREMIMSDGSYFQKCYELGKKDMREQMLKDAVEGKVFMSFAPGHNQMVMADVDLPTNTKVKLIIVRED